MPDVNALLVAHPWPGNVRELRNAMEHAFAMAEGASLGAAHFALDPHGFGRGAPRAPRRARAQLGDAERAMIEGALSAEGGNQTRAAARLGMPRRTLVRKLAQYRSESDGED